MRKVLSLSFIACMCQAMVCAQTINPSSASQHTIRMVRSMNNAGGNQVAKTTAVVQRVTGYRSANAAGQTGDSMRYVYDFGRGSEFDFDDMAYYDYPVYPDVYGNKLVACDSAHRVGSLAKKSWSGYVGNRIVHSGGESSNAIDSIDWVYDAQGRQTELIWERYYKTPPSAATPYVYHYYKYNAAGRLVTDSSERKSANWEINQVSTMTYNAAGQVDTLTYISGPASFIALDYRYIFGYTGSNMTSILQQNYGSGTWNDYERKTITYTGQQKTSEITEEWNGGWVLQAEEYRRLNANGLPDSIYFGTKGNTNPFFALSPDTVIRKLTYNSFDNPVTMDYYDAAMVYEGQTRYWYQEYDPQHIAGTAAAGMLTVYPNPAREALYIAATLSQPDALTVTLADVTGKTILEQSFELPAGKVRQAVSLAAIAPGMYVYRVTSATGAVYNSGKVVKE